MKTSNLTTGLCSECRNALHGDNLVNFAKTIQTVDFKGAIAHLQALPDEDIDFNVICESCGLTGINKVAGKIELEFEDE